ncbi:MAG: pyruvate:ferredoxin (flavodoxin) oxidoreductase [Candidatus Methylacidiphilales bacterium]|nr:pyruvate:ferredoxin (flavodoxin) oxidoreductase [Candidatus Methylacidiphilales bacterium]
MATTPAPTKPRNTVTMEGNEAVARIAYKLSEVIAIYPITPSTSMGELADEWASRRKENLWGSVPRVVQMQSEAGVAGAVHGMLQAGSLATTFTASQGLLLMIPIMYKIAGQLMPFCLHVAARSLATHGLSIFGDHSDVMAVRQTGFAMLASAGVQEAQDMACIAHAATLQTRIPFLHFFDGFRTSHETNGVERLDDKTLRAMLDEESMLAQSRRGLSPDRPVIRGTAQNPDAYFQGREAVNAFYDRTPALVQELMYRFATLTGRTYHLFDYTGHPLAERVVVIMGSGGETVREVVRHLMSQEERVGVIQVRLFRPFDVAALVNALPPTVKKIAVLDRTKEPGSVGEPLFQDVVTALAEADTARWSEGRTPVVIGGRYGLASKEFTPAMVLSVLNELKAAQPRRRFTVGICDDVTRLSLAYDPSFGVEDEENRRCLFYGLGSDGTVGANKNTIKIIGDKAGLHAQAYFVYDSKKSGAATVSHLRFGAHPIRAPYLIQKAHFIGVHQWNLLDQFDVLESAAPGGVFLLNTVHAADVVWDHLSLEVQESIISRKLRFHVIDAYQVARECGLGGRINTIMQTCFFALSDIMPLDQAISEIKAAIEKTYLRKGKEVVEKNFRSVDRTLENLREVIVPKAASAARHRPPPLSAGAPQSVLELQGELLAGRGDSLPVSAFPIDGTWPVGTSRWEKRNLALEIPGWDPELCIQCNKCVLVCPHAAIRAKHYDEKLLGNAPTTFRSVPFRSPENKGHRYTIQVAPEDCTGCKLCIQVCPAKDKSNAAHKALNLVGQPAVREAEKENYDFFLALPSPDRTTLKPDLVKDSQFMEPLFEYSGACVGCGETPYIKLLTQMFGDRALIANATGCSSIYGGNLPTTPYTCNSEGRGPAWANSLFEDNAEFGLGIRVASDARRAHAGLLLRQGKKLLGESWVAEILEAPQTNEAEIAAQRARVAELKRRLPSLPPEIARPLAVLADELVRRSVWIVGGDGWAYDIGFGGLDHVMSQGQNVNILVLDTEVYSNTGGQQSKSTPIGAVAKFATGGKETSKKDLGLLAMGYGNVYVARVAFGAKDSQTVKVFAEAESYPGTSLILAYSHCIAHGYNLSLGLQQQKLAVDSGHWPLFRYDPRRKEEGKPSLVLDSGPPKVGLSSYVENEVRYRSLQAAHPERSRQLIGRAQEEIHRQHAHYTHLAQELGGHEAGSPGSGEKGGA